MTSEATVFTDRPPYDSELIRMMAFAGTFIMAPVFLLIIFTEPEYAIALGLIWISVPLIVIAVPYLLMVPALITLTTKSITVKHGIWKITIPLLEIEKCEVVSLPPWWANFQHVYPNAQWVHITKSKGRLDWWYIPTTSATQLVLAIRRAQEG